MNRSQRLFFIATIIIILLCVHVVIYAAVFSFISLSPRAALIPDLLLILLPLSFIGANILIMSKDELWRRIVYWIVSVWTGFLLYYFIASVIYALAAGIIIWVKPSYSTFIFGTIVFLAATLINFYAIYQDTLLKTTSYEIVLPNLPSNWQNKKIVWISDLHIGPINRERWTAKIVERVNALNPEVVFIGGDLFDGTKLEPSEFLNFLKKLNPKYGIFFITGNHDGFYTQSQDFFQSAIKQAGIKILNNELVNLDELQIIGVDYASTTSGAKYSEILQKLAIDKSKPSILLKHTPSNLDIAQLAGINLQISGHTHRAQMRPLDYLAKMIFHGYIYGLSNFKNMQVLISSGAATWGPPLRLGTNNEVVEITLK